MDGDGESPPFDWMLTGTHVQSFALVMEEDNPEKGLIYHWVIWNIPSTASKLSQNLPKIPILQDGSDQGTNDFGGIG